MSRSIPDEGLDQADTIDFLHNGRAERIRFSGIDCPEKGQAYDTRRLYAELKRADPTSICRKDVP